MSSAAAVAPASSTGLATGSDCALAALEELQEYHSGACRERVAFRQERSDLNARFTRCEHELWAEEQIGRDLARRIATLEAAIRRERVQYEGLLKAAQPSELGAAEGAGGTGVPVLDPSGAPAGPSRTVPAQQEAQILAAYLERFPQARERSCRHVLIERLQRAGLSDPSARFRENNGASGFGGYGGSSSEQAAAAEATDRGIRQETSEYEEERGGGSSSNAPREAGSTSSTASCTRPRLSETSQRVPTEQRGVDSTGCPQGLPRETWGRRWTFRSHLEGARCVCCDELAGLLVSCGEDALIKGWDLGPLWRGAPQSDEFEPYVTFRGHTAPVLCLAYRPQDRTLFSAGMDYTIRAWQLPESGSYNAYSANVTSQHGTLRLGMLSGHSDSVWSLDRHPQLPYVASASADGSIAIWAADAEGLSRETGVMEASLVMQACRVDNAAKDAEVAKSDLDTPSCVAWVPTDVTKVLGGYTSSRVALFDAKRGSQVLDIQPGGPGITAVGGDDRAVTSACCHQNQQLAAIGHADHCARLVDLSSGRFVSTLAEHSDAVTSVCIDPAKGHLLATGCHDGCARTFDLRTGRCCQVLRLHESKYDESIHCVLLHQKLLATAGADGGVVVMLQE